ncbi:MAG: Tetratricopeptide repeat-containing protein [Mucilaginibacter sp.]|nr:Tetratricopeptide repeat-containing protein [Mucilaginibacter sp.]
MKKLFFITLISIQGLFTHAQTFKDIPRLTKLLKNHISADTTRVLLQIDYAIAYKNINIDTSLLYANRAMNLSYKIGYPIGVIKGLNEIGTNYFLQGDYAKALKFYFDVIKKSEKIHYERGLGAAYTNVANIYIVTDDFKIALNYLLKAKRIFEKADFKNNLIITYNEIGKAYLELNPDSALIFCNLAYQIATKNHNESVLGPITIYLGQIHERLGNNELALSYYTLSVKYFSKNRDNYDLSFSYYLLSEYYRKNNMPDSALFYANKAFSYAQNSKSPQAIQYSSKLLFEHYKSLNSDSALKYLLTSINVKDSFFGGNNLKQIQNLEITELRREEKSVNESHLNNMRHIRNIKFIGISLGIAFICLLLSIFNLIRVRSGLVKGMGVFVLLLLFEFISLFIHPYLEVWTDNNPVKMLAILAVLASVLVPIHHRTENWIKKTFEKRKLYR